MTETRAQYVKWDDVEIEQLSPMLGRQMIVGSELMIARVLLKKGTVVPTHSHHNEQITYILEGVLRFEIDGRQIDVKAGEVLCIPPNMPHQATALEDTVDLDVFYPPRQDWIDKSDARPVRGKDEIPVAVETPFQPLMDHPFSVFAGNFPDDPVRSDLQDTVFPGARPTPVGAVEKKADNGDILADVHPGLGPRCEL